MNRAETNSGPLRGHWLPSTSRSPFDGNRVRSCIAIIAPNCTGFAIYFSLPWAPMKAQIEASFCSATFGSGSPVILLHGGLGHGGN